MCASNTIALKWAETNFYLKIGRHKWPNDYMFDWSILCFGWKMAKDRPLFCTLHAYKVSQTYILSYSLAHNTRLPVKDIRTHTSSLQDCVKIAVHARTYAHAHTHTFPQTWRSLSLLTQKLETSFAVEP